MKIFEVCKLNSIINSCRFSKNYTASVPVQNNSLDRDVVEIKNPYVQETEFGVIKRLKNGKLDELVFNKPVSLEMAFQIVKNAQEKYGICHNGKLTKYRLNSLENYEFLEKFDKMKFTKFVGSGSKIYAFESKDGKVLKIGEVPHFTCRDNVEDFDAPIFERGSVNNKYYYYIQKKCSKENITQEDLEEMEKQIKAKGYDVVDMGLGQVGRGDDGKLYLIDYECAIPDYDSTECTLVYF